MSPSSQRPSSSSRDLTLVVESESGTPEEYFAQVALSIGRAKSNTIHIDHPDVDHIHAKVVKREESFWLRCEGQARLQVLDPEPGEVEEVELMPGLTIELGGVIIRCRRQMRGMSNLSDDYWAEAAGGERFRVETETFTGDLPKKIGPYEIRKYVARGGMGIVLQGLHEETAQLAAVKLPTPDLNKDQQWLKRFEQEVRTLKSVTHPNLVRLQDAGQEGELHWMAMDWVEGWTVGERLAVYKEAGEPMPLSEIQLVLRQVVEGLMTLHSKGVVHRDLKPGNLLVGQDGGVKVADFGLAKQVGGEQSTVLTRTGTFAGTMHYMAPEQAEGMEITSATDIYSLGVIWHELLTGRKPGRRLKLKEQRPDCPKGWGNLIEQCLDDEPGDRPGLQQIKQALEAESFEVVISSNETVDDRATSTSRAKRTEMREPPSEEQSTIDDIYESRFQDEPEAPAPDLQTRPSNEGRADDPAPQPTTGVTEVPTPTWQRGTFAPEAQPVSEKSGGILKWVAAAAVIGLIIYGVKWKREFDPFDTGAINIGSGLYAPPAGAFVNTLGMAFVPVPGTDVQFSIWETRVKDYAAYAAANSGVDASWKKPSVLGISISQETTHPVVNVSWEDANAFCAWLTKKELAEGKIKAGQKYRLPTDAEWSVAVGLGQETGSSPEEKDMGVKDVYPWGNQWPPPKEAGNYGGSLNVDNYEYTSPVGSFAANKLGLHDMGGNVWEWCEDWYDPAAKAYRVLRGASCRIYAPDGLLSSYRGYGTPDPRISLIGFRCVLVDGSGG